MKASFANVLETEFVVTGLTEDQIYEFRIIARNSAGVSSQPSDSTGSITAKDEVDPPKIDLEAKYSQAVVVNAGETFRLEAAIAGKPVPTVHWQKEGQEIAEAARLELKNTDFTACLVVKEAIRVDGGQYTLLVKNVGGEKSVNINVKVLDRPGPPDGPISIYGVTSEKCSIAWKSPLQDGGSDVSHYIVEKRETSRLVWTVVEQKVQTLNLKITKLLPGNEYIFRVIPVNKYGVGEPLESGPMIAKNQFVTSNSPTDDGAALKQTTRVNVTDSARHTTLTIKDAIREDGGMYSINIVNSLGSKDATIEVITLDKPGPPTGPVKFEDVSAESMTLNWEPPTYTGGCPISNYVVEKRDTTTTNWVVLSATLARTTLKVSNLKTGSEYQFRIYAENRYGKSYAIDSAPIVAQYPFQEPGPSGTPFVATYSKDYMVVEWHKPPSDGGSAILGYHLERKEKNSILWTKINKMLIQDCRFKSAPLEEGIEYEYRVYAENIVGIGKCSKISEVYVARDPCYPPGLPEAVIVTRHSVKLKWTAPEYNGGSLITGYVVEKRDLPEGKWMKASFANVIEHEFTVTGLTEHSKYDFRVIARNAAGAVSKPSESTGSITAMDEIDPPKCETDPMYNQTIKCYLHWNHPSHDGGASISHYIIEKRETSRLSWTMIEPKIQAISYKITKLLPGNEYIFRVTAVNKYGVGEPLESEAVIARNPFTTPSAPSTPETSAITRDSIVLTWERPEHNGGAEIEGYILEKRDMDGIRWTKCNKKRLSDLRFRCTGLTEGHSYEFRISAENAGGVGKPSEPTEYIKACDAIYPPGAPNNPKVTGHSSTTVSLSWTRPIYDGGAQISGYVVERKEATDDEWITCTPPTGVQATHYTVKHLKENAEYNFRICAINCEGVGEHVDLLSSVIAAEKLEAPEIELDADLRKMVNVRATASLRLFVTIRGKPEPEVRWSKADGTLNERAQIEVTSSYTMLVIENVDRFDTGKYVLNLENLSGSKSAFINVRVLDSPSAPTNLVVKDVKRTSVSLSWEPPSIDGGAKISHYIVEKREQKRMAFTSVCTSCVRNSYIISDLQEGGRYYFRVLAVNELGVGLPASTDQVKVAEAPLPPGKVVLIDVTRHTVSLSWEKPDHDGGSKITNFIVEMQPKGDDKWSVCSEVKALEATIGGLTTGEEYSFRVIAVNDKGKSDAKPLATPVVVKDITMLPIVNLLYDTYSVKAGDDLKVDVPFRGRPQPEVSWKKDGQALKQTTRVNVLTSKTSSKIVIKDATKEDVGKYVITLTNSVGTSTNQFKMTGIEEGLLYQFRVYAENMAGIGPCTKASDPVAARDPCESPRNLRVTNITRTSVSLFWEKPEYDGGIKITGYIVERKELPSGRWLKCNFTNLQDTYFDVTGLTEDVQYDFHVITKNSAELLSAPSESTG
uniref:Titin n=1 Tax=Cyclopterus lumpus TaxID=8103 RepID=A0A8C2ZMA2_CYCLU